LKKSKKAPNPPSSALFRPPARADAYRRPVHARASTGERARRTIHERRFSLDFPSIFPRASRVARRSRVEIHPLASGFSRRGKKPREITGANERNVDGDGDGDGDDLASALNRSFRTFSRVETPPRLAFASRARRDESTPRPRARRSLTRKRSSPTEKSGFYR
jgi:hypothetical protein|tara:strand:+ start:9055 stop:9543 length:489 start_codon:yes stop_codon:yes gene_type:complete